MGGEQIASIFWSQGGHRSDQPGTVKLTAQRIAKILCPRNANRRRAMGGVVPMGPSTKRRTRKKVAARQNKAWSSGSVRRRYAVVVRCPKNANRRPTPLTPTELALSTAKGRLPPKQGGPHPTHVAQPPPAVRGCKDGAQPGAAVLLCRPVAIPERRIHVHRDDLPKRTRLLKEIEALRSQLANYNP